MYRLDKPSYYKALSVCFKLPITRSQSVGTWLKEKLPDINEGSDLRFDTLIEHFKVLSETVTASEKAKSPKRPKQKRNQVGHIALYLS